MLQSTCLALLALGLLFTVAEAASAKTINIRDSYDDPKYKCACDGVTDDTAALQNIINDKLKDGDTLVIPGPSLTGLGAPGVTIRDHKKIKVTGKAGGGFRYLSRGTQNCAGGYNSYGQFVIWSCKDCVVENLMVDGNRVNASFGVFFSERCTFRYITITRAGSLLENPDHYMNGVFLGASNIDNKYLHLTITNTVQHTPAWAGPRTMLLGNIREKGMLDYTESDYELRPEVAYCVFQHNGCDGVIGHMGEAWIHDNMGSDIAYGALICITSVSKHVTSKPSIVENNLIYDMATSGLQFGNSHNLIIRNNRIENCHDAGILMSPIMPNSELWSYMLDSGNTNGTSDVLITGNTIINTGPGNMNGGIQFHQGYNIEISHNTIIDNRPTAIMPHGIELHGDYLDYENIRIFDNTITGAAGNGVVLCGAANDGQRNYKNVVIENNRFLNNGAYGIATDGNARLIDLKQHGNMFEGNKAGMLGGKVAE